MGANTTSNPLINHAPTAGINTLITEEEGFDPVCLITDMLINQSLLPSPYTMREIVRYDLSSSNLDEVSPEEKDEDTEEDKDTKEEK